MLLNDLKRSAVSTTPISQKRTTRKRTAAKPSKKRTEKDRAYEREYARKRTQRQKAWRAKNPDYDKNRYATDPEYAGVGRRGVKAAPFPYCLKQDLWDSYQLSVISCQKEWFPSEVGSAADPNVT